MARFLIDANLPYRFSLWQGQDYLHVFDLSDTWSDSEIWRYAREQELTVVTKDADFSALAILNEPPPWVIHFRIGNNENTGPARLFSGFGPTFPHSAPPINW